MGAVDPPETVVELLATVVVGAVDTPETVVELLATVVVAVVVDPVPVGAVTVSAANVTAVCASNLPFTVDPVFTTIAV